MLLSPAKSLDFTSRPVTRKHSEPRFLDHSAELIEVLRTKSPDELSKLMKISDELAVLNHARYRDFELPFTSKNARAAILAFNGDVYRGMDAPHTFGERDFTEAQKTVRILSGLYGVLRPLDLIQPYRLEMGIPLKTAHARDLYQYWGELPSEVLKQDLADAPGSEAVINLASNEYFGVVDPKVLGAPIISPRFEEVNPSGRRRMVSFFAKQARGAMAGWIVRHRVRSVRKLREFDADGYRFDRAASTAGRPVFVRPQVS